MQRVVGNLERYRLWRPEWAARLEVFEGDASLSGMGLSAADLSYLRTATDRVAHAAAQVNLLADMVTWTVVKNAALFDAAVAAGAR